MGAGEVGFGALHGALQGMAFGISSTVKPVLWGRYFGRRHVGSIMGIEKFTVIAGTATGPLLYGVVRDETGSFDLTLSISVILPLAMIPVLLFGIPTPEAMASQKREEEEQDDQEEEQRCAVAGEGASCRQATCPPPVDAEQAGEYVGVYVGVAAGEAPGGALCR